MNKCRLFWLELLLLLFSYFLCLQPAHTETHTHTTILWSFCIEIYYIFSAWKGDGAETFYLIQNFVCATCAAAVLQQLCCQLFAFVALVVVVLVAPTVAVAVVVLLIKIFLERQQEVQPSAVFLARFPFVLFSLLLFSFSFFFVLTQVRSLLF